MWFRVEDGFTEHPKVLKAATLLGGPGAYARVLGFWLYSGLHCVRQLTDGYVSNFIVEHTPCEPDPVIIAKCLVAAGLWDQVEGGFQFHDWTDYQPDSGEVKRKRAYDRERMRDIRRQRLVNDSSTSLKRENRPDPDPDLKNVGIASKVNVLPHADGSRAREEHDLLTEPDRTPKNRAKGKEHRGHAWCCERGMCVPHSLHSELIGRIGNEATAVTQLIEFYECTIASMNGHVIGDDVWSFWRNSFQKRFGLVTVENIPQKFMSDQQRRVQRMNERRARAAAEES